MTRTPKPSLDECWDLARRLGEQVRAREAERQVADQIAKRSIASNAQASDDLSRVLLPYKALMTAIVGNAGSSSKKPLSVAVDEARHALEQSLANWPTWDPEDGSTEADHTHTEEQT